MDFDHTIGTWSQIRVMTVKFDFDRNLLDDFSKNPAG
jgi:hypothetical protein